MPTPSTTDEPRTRPARWRGRRQAAAVTALLTLLVLSGCAPRDSITAPVGPEAADINALWWFILILGSTVYVVVMVLVAVPLVRSWRLRRRGEPTTADAGGDGGAAVGVRGVLATPPAAVEDEPLAVAPDAGGTDPDADRRVRSRLLWLGGVILPVIILAVLLVATSLTGAAVSHVTEDEDLVIDVVGHKFWWEVTYPDHDIVTANEIHVPTGQRVRLNLVTEDVIHSFWVPRVHGKIDMIPGTDNIMTFTVEEPGRYRGQCAEYCGVAHAQMATFLVAQEPDEFDAWVEGQRQEAAEPETEQRRAGQQAFFEYGCADCHGVAGHGAVGDVGPDLSHLASRGSLAAGIVPNDRENLTELIVDPWGVKAGNPMPPTNIADDDLEALLDYLEGLE